MCKSCPWETLNILACVNSSKHTRTKKWSHVTITRHMSAVSCHLTTTPCSFNCYESLSRTQNPPFFSKYKFLHFAFLAILSLTRSLQSRRFRVSADGTKKSTDTQTHIATYKLNRPRGPFSENVAKYTQNVPQAQLASPRILETMIYSYKS